VAPLWDQARVCAIHLAELGVSRFRAKPPATRLKVAGVELYSAGDFAAAEGGETLLLRDLRHGVYRRLVIRDNRLRGAVLYGDASHSEWYFDLMTAGEDVTALRDQLLFGPPVAPVAPVVAPRASDTPTADARAAASDTPAAAAP
jgi:nitrite reductase [NAD(P)H] large subunit